MEKNLESFEKLFSEKIENVLGNKDIAHDYLHVERVVKQARKLALLEQGDLWVVIPSAWLHDLVNLSKNDPRRKEASKLCADEAIKYLNEINYPSQFFAKIHHAIVAHSFSAKVPAETIEAKIVQDADRLDALGSVGLFRLLSVSTELKRPLYMSADPFCEFRVPDDTHFAIDHIEIKLRKISQTMNTQSAKEEAIKRLAFIDTFLIQLKTEI